MRLSRQRGYTLLFAVLTATLTLGVTVFILSVSRKQYILASAARESTYAVYAAYSGLECAALAYGAGTLIQYDASVPPAPDSSGMSCGGTSSLASSWVNLDFVGEAGLADGKKIGTAHKFPFSGNCAQIMVYTGTDAAGVAKTVIESRGYSICGTGSDPEASPLNAERAFRLTYE